MLPEEVSSLLASAQTCVQSHDYQHAVALYTNALTHLDPQTAVPDLKESRLCALRECGRLLGILGDQETALALHEQYQREAGETRHGLIGLVYIGQHLRGLGRYQDALKAYEKALALAEQLQDAAGQARSLMGIGSTYLVQGATEQALDCFAEAYEHFAASGNVQGQVQMSNLTGVAQATSGQFEMAIDAFQNGLKMARQMQLHEREAVLLNNLGECYQMLFATEQALACHQEGLALAERAQLRLVEADLCRNMGIDLRYLGRIGEGMGYFQRALSISRATGNVDIEQYTLYALARTEFVRENTAAALTYAEQLRETAVLRNARHHLAAALYLIGLARQKQRDDDAAAEAWQQAQFLAHETESRMLLWRIHAAQATIAPTQGLADVHWRIAHEIIQQISKSIQDQALRDTFLAAPPVWSVLMAIDAQLSC